MKAVLLKWFPGGKCGMSILVSIVPSSLVVELTRLVDRTYLVLELKGR